MSGAPMDRIVTRGSTEWPRLMNEMEALGAPERLYARGREIDGNARFIGIVGTRRPSVAGLVMAERFSAHLVRAGFVIVSGLAIGVDAAAHRAAMDAGGRTIAVVGCGIDVVYPRQNAGLRERIVGFGTLLSEYEQGAPPERWRFPQRNRIIAGICEAVLVVEGARKSGALITARCALDANRDVFATPGSPLNPRAEGANDLIRTSQAGLVLHPDHILEEIAAELVPASAANERIPPLPHLDEIQRRLLAAFDGSALSVELIGTRLGTTTGEIAVGLLGLEMRHLVVRRHGAYELTPTGAEVVEHLLRN